MSHGRATKTKEAEQDVTFAEGGDTPMFGKQSAGPDKPGNTGKDTTGAPGPKFAERRHGQDVRLYAARRPARPGRTGAR